MACAWALWRLVETLLKKINSHVRNLHRIASIAFLNGNSAYPHVEIDAHKALKLV